MIPKEQLEAFKTTVLNAKRPLFFYDDDADGLCSYLLCYRARGDGVGVRVGSSATVTPEYARKVDENLPDLVVILDKPNVDPEFLAQVNVPVLWLDHHEPQKPGKGVTYLNPRIEDDKDNKSTTYWVYRALGRPEDLWMAAVGSISDWQITDLAEEFWSAYPKILHPVKEPPEALYGTPFGELCKLFQFNLKGDAAGVRTAVKILSRVESAEELLEHNTPRSKLIYKRFEKLHREYERYLIAARKSVGKDRLVFHEFSYMETSLLAELANQMLFEFPEKIILLTRVHNGDHKLSIRSKDYDIASAVKEAMAKGIRGNAGGHMHACGGNIKSEDFPLFLETFTDAIAKQYK